MTLFIKRWAVDRKKDKYTNPENKIIMGKNASACMKQFNDLKAVSDLFAFTPWQIIDIKD